MNILEGDSDSISTSIVAVALDVPPVIVSPTTNLPVVPRPVSPTTLLPSSFRIKFVDVVSCMMLLITPDTVSSAASRNS